MRLNIMKPKDNIEYYKNIPTAILASKSLTPAEKLVLQTIFGYAQFHKKRCTLTNAGIAARTNINAGSVANIIGSLAKRRIIVRKTVQISVQKRQREMYMGSNFKRLCSSYNEGGVHSTMNGGSSRNEYKNKNKNKKERGKTSLPKSLSKDLNREDLTKQANALLDVYKDLLRQRCEKYPDVRLPKYNRSKVIAGFKRQLQDESYDRLELMLQLYFINKTKNRFVVRNNYSPETFFVSNVYNELNSLIQTKHVQRR